jgi:D-arginine utilization repressor
MGARSTTVSFDLAPFESLIEGVVALLHPHAEVVVHDVRKDRVVAIWNPFSARKVGDRSLLGALADVAPSPRSGDVLGPYEKVGVDGHRVVSVSIPIANGAGMVCINLDRHPLDQAITMLQRFAQAVEPQPQVLFERDWREEIHRVVEEWCRQHHVDQARLNRQQRAQLLMVLDDKGLFATRNAATLVSHTLNISRATVYASLQEIRS